MEQTFAMTAGEPQTLALEAPAAARSRAQRRDSFWSQTPLALLAIGAVAAIVAVNWPVSAPAPVSTSLVAALTAHGDIDANCAACGEIVAVQLVSLHPETAPTIKTFELSVRMDDGTRRTIRQFAPAFGVGDRVRVQHRALAQHG